MFVPLLVAGSCATELPIEMIMVVVMMSLASGIIYINGYMLLSIWLLCGLGGSSRLSLSSFTMSRIKQLLEKLEVANEPGLSNAQLMLTNNDLRPGEVFKQPAGFVLSSSPSSSRGAVSLTLP